MFNISNKSEFDNQKDGKIKFMTTTDIKGIIEQKTKSNLVLKKVGAALRMLGYKRESGKKSTSQSSCKGYYVKPVFEFTPNLSDFSDSGLNKWYKVLIISK